MQPQRVCFERYLNWANAYVQGRVGECWFRCRVAECWAQEREGFWSAAWEASEPRRAAEKAELVAGRRPRAGVDDPRVMARFVDRLQFLCLGGVRGELTALVSELLAAYRHPDAVGGEADGIWYPARVNLFQRLLPPESRQRYGCTLEEIRRQIAEVPEADLVGLWAVGLVPMSRDNAHCYGVYYRHWPQRYWWSKGRSVIVLPASRPDWRLKLDAQSDRGWMKQSLAVEIACGMQVRRRGDHLICRWRPDDLGRYLLEHVLLHEIGHHVQYQRRWRSGSTMRLPSHQKEQFAEDYALRMARALGSAWAGYAGPSS